MLKLKLATDRTDRSSLGKIYTRGNIIMPILSLILVLVAVGVGLWLINNYIPMDGKIKSILNAVVVIGVIIWLLQVFGILGSLNAVTVG